MRLHRADVDSIESELKKIGGVRRFTGGVPFVVWAKGVAVKPRFRQRRSMKADQSSGPPKDRASRGL